jgi:hypothetical protein
MKPDEFQQQLDQLGWDHSNFCRMAEIDRNTVNRWAKGTVPIPSWVPGFLTTARDLKQLSNVIDRCERVEHSERRPQAAN